MPKTPNSSNKGFGKAALNVGNAAFNSMFPILGNFVDAFSFKNDKKVQQNARDYYSEDREFALASEHVMEQLSNTNALLITFNEKQRKENILLQQIIDSYDEKNHGLGNLMDSLLNFANDAINLYDAFETVKNIREKIKGPKKPSPEEERARIKEEQDRIEKERTAREEEFNKRAEGPKTEIPTDAKPVEKPSFLERANEFVKENAYKAGKKLGELEEAVSIGVGESLLKTGGKLLLPLAVASTCWEAYEKIKQLDTKDPNLNSKVTEIISGLVARFGFVTVSTIFGTIVGSAIPGAGNIVGFLSGLAVGVTADLMLGDNVESLVSKLVEHILMSKEEKSKRIEEQKKEFYNSMGGAPKFGPNPFKKSIPQVVPNNSNEIPLAQKVSYSTNENSTSQLEKIIFDASKITFDSENFTSEDTKNSKSPYLNQNNNGITKASFSTDSGPSDATQQSTESFSETPQQEGSWWNRHAPSWLGGSSNNSYGEDLNRTVGKEEQGTADRVIDFFTSKGWTKEQAAGFAANISIESNFKTNETGDNGQAYGLAQWHPDRQKDFKIWAKKDIRDSTFEEQLEFIQYELTKGKESGNASYIMAAKTPSEAAKAIDDVYERSDKSAQRKRMQLADLYNKGQSTTVNNTGLEMNNMSTAQVSADTSKKKINLSVPGQNQNIVNSQSGSGSTPTNSEPDFASRAKHSFGIIQSA